MNNQSLNGINPLSYLGVNAQSPMNFVIRNNDPTTTDNRNFYIGDMWLNRENNRIYQLTNLEGGVAQWLGVAYFITQTRNPVSGDYLYPLGTMWLNTNTENVYQLLAVNGTSATWVLMMDSTGPLLQITTGDSNVVTPSGGNINLIGIGNISTTGSGSTATVSLIGTTNHALQVGNSIGNLTSLAVATNGQIPIGSTSANPVLATITAGTNTSVVNGSGSITIGSSQAQTLSNYTAVSTSPYTVSGTDYYLGVNVSTIAITVQLPNAPTNNTIFVIKDINGNAATHNITVTTVGGVVTIDGSTSLVMNTNYEAINLAFVGSSYQVY